MQEKYSSVLCPSNEYTNSPSSLNIDGVDSLKVVGVVTPTKPIFKFPYSLITKGFTSLSLFSLFPV